MFDTVYFYAECRDKKHRLHGEGTKKEVVDYSHTYGHAAASKEYGLQDKTVRRWCKERSDPLKKLSAEETQEIVRLGEAGDASLAAKRFGIPYPRVLKICRNAGVEFVRHKKVRSPEDRKKLAELAYEKGAPAVAKEAGLSPTTIYKYINEFGIKMPGCGKKYEHEDDRLRIAEFAYEHGDAKAAKKYGISDTTVCVYREEFGFGTYKSRKRA